MHFTDHENRKMKREMETAEEDLQVRDREELKGQTDKRIKRTNRQKN